MTRRGRNPVGPRRLSRGIWPLLIILVIAAAVRAWKLGEWSLWEDEEGSIYFSQNPSMPFPRFFPIFFLALRWVFGVTGVSVLAGRSLAAMIGVLGVGLVYVSFRRILPREERFLASLLVSLCIGHIFLSQSIRYYTTAFAFQMLAIMGFLEGFERKRIWPLLWSNLALVGALFSHFSAVLLAPVFVSYLVLVGWFGGGERYPIRLYVASLGPLVLTLATFARGMADLRRLMSDFVIPSARDYLHVLITLVCYFGPPLAILAIVGSFLTQRLPWRVRLFLLLLGWIPVLELIIIAMLNAVNVTWYYGLISLAGLAALSSVALVEMFRRYRRLTLVVGSATLLYCVGMLAAYGTVMHGDRPRWKEASAYLRNAARIDPQSSENPPIFGSITGVIAFYLGVDSSETMSQGLVRRVPLQPPGNQIERTPWFVVEAKQVSDEYREWFARNCILEARFESRTGPVDRSVLVYRHRTPMEEPNVVVSGEKDWPQSKVGWD